MRRSPSTNRAAIWSCRRERRSASPCTDPTAQIRRAPRRRASLPSGPPFSPPSTRPFAAGARKGRSGGRQQLLDSADRCCFVDPLDRRELADQPVERGLIDLPLAVGL